MANSETKELATLAEVFKALGHPTRLLIAKNMEGRELCVCDFVAGTNEEFSSISQHLNVLKKAHDGSSNAWKLAIPFPALPRRSENTSSNSSARCSSNI